ncbi:MAG: hypothetical protein ACUVXA_17770 [Candidatus Jordarchaeum sp.]|uniref:hypothetical protein n=1 Tax=Candidatus Jordarchaeum sp. TaxID=2823881 RepID=UPI00404A9ECF
MEKSFDLEKQIIEFCNQAHSAKLKATLVKDWYRDIGIEGGHTETTLIEIHGNSRDLAEKFIKAIRNNPNFKKFILDPKYELRHGKPIPWKNIKKGKTLRGKRCFKAEVGYRIGFGAGFSDYCYAIRIEEV